MYLVISMRYCLFVFIAVIGLLQAAAGRNNLQGISFFKNKYHAYFFSTLTIGSSLFAFFTWNYWYATGVIEGGQQFGLFVLSSSLAIIFTFLISSAIKHATANQVLTRQEGLESLKTATILHVLQSRLKGRT